MHSFKHWLAVAVIAIPTSAFAQFYVSLENIQTAPSTCTDSELTLNISGSLAYVLPATSNNLVFTTTINGIIFDGGANTFNGPFPASVSISSSTTSVGVQTRPYTLVATYFPATDGAVTGTGTRLTATCAANGTVTVAIANEVPSAVTPQVGLWWNPAESGSGYAFDFKHGTLVVTVYSYNADGTPLWYIVTGPVTGNTFTGALNRTTRGQCISCAYQQPISAGNDGTMTIVFATSTAATMTLPGGRVIPVVPQSF